MTEADVIERDEDAPVGDDAQPPQPRSEEDQKQDLRLLEAVLFASAEPMSEKALAARLPEGANLRGLLATLRADFEGRGFRLVHAGSSWAFRTAPDIAQRLGKEIEVSRKLSRAALETLAIIAYHQPVTRAEIEEVRGVSLSKGTLDVLFEEGWIRPKGKRRTPGRPVTWGTTDVFLDHFGLERLLDLPGTEELKAAGLLDARPAIEAYATSGKLGGDEDLAPEEDELDPDAREAEESLHPQDDPLEPELDDDIDDPLDPEMES